MSWSTLGSIVDSLPTHCSMYLLAVNWAVPFQLSQVICALDSLPSLTSICLELHCPPSNDLGPVVTDSASFLDLPTLRQLSLGRYVKELMERACRWKTPSLKSFSLDLDYNLIERPDIVQFLTHHGSKLIFLDIDSSHTYDVAKILDLCPLLQTFAFNADWGTAYISRQSSHPPTPPTHNPHWLTRSSICIQRPRHAGAPI
jgi:hypothetical protein